VTPGAKRRIFRWKRRFLFSSDALCRPGATRVGARWGEFGDWTMQRVALSSAYEASLPLLGSLAMRLDADGDSRFQEGVAGYLPLERVAPHEVGAQGKTFPSAGSIRTPLSDCP
jgi:hypothetical protein